MYIVTSDRTLYSFNFYKNKDESSNEQYEQRNLIKKQGQIVHRSGK